MMTLIAEPEERNNLMIHKMNVTLAILALAASPSTVSAQTRVWGDDFSGPLVDWMELNGQIAVVSGQFVVSGISFGPFQTNTPTATHAAGYHAIPTSGPLPDNQTLELRADLIGTSENDAWASLHFLWPIQGQGYIFFKDQDEVVTCKFYNAANSLAFFSYENRPLPNANVTLALALTRRGSNVEITTRVLDKDNANAVLFERTVTDTPLADPVLPSGTVRGARSEPDMPGTPWPVVAAPENIELGVTWVNSQQAPDGNAAATFDNLVVWRYESPPLAIQNAVLLSWPLTSGYFVLESALTVDGPWEPVPNPWSRTNAAQNEVCVLAPDSMKLFRLRFVP